MALPAKRRTIVAFAVLIEGGLGVLATVVGAVVGHDPWQTIAWQGGAAFAGIVAAVPMLGLFALLWRAPIPSLVEMRSELTSRVLPLFRHCSMTELALVCAAAGLGEELLFRRLLQGGLTPSLGQAQALVLASALFGLAHPITPVYAVTAGFLGAYLGGLWLACGNLLVPVLAHGLYDFVALVAVLRRQALD